MATIQHPPLIAGRRMLCPRCKKYHDILEYIPMQQIEAHADETNPIYKCPECRWAFSPVARVMRSVVP